MGCTELATEVPNGIVIIQGQAAHEGVQFLEAVADLRRVGFVGLGVGLVELIQDGHAFTVTRIEGVGLYVVFCRWASSSMAAPPGGVELL